MDSYLKGCLILCCIFISSCATHLERGESLELEGKYQQAADEYSLGLEKDEKNQDLKISLLRAMRFNYLKELERSGVEVSAGNLDSALSRIKKVEDSYSQSNYTYSIQEKKLKRKFLDNLMVKLEFMVENILNRDYPISALLFVERYEQFLSDEEEYTSIVSKIRIQGENKCKKMMTNEVYFLGNFVAKYCKKFNIDVAYKAVTPEFNFDKVKLIVDGKSENINYSFKDSSLYDFSGKSLISVVSDLTFQEEKEVRPAHIQFPYTKRAAYWVEESEPYWVDEPYYYNTNECSYYSGRRSCFMVEKKSFRSVKKYKHKKVKRYKDETDTMRVEGKEVTQNFNLFGKSALYIYGEIFNIVHNLNSTHVDFYHDHRAESLKLTPDPLVLKNNSQAKIELVGKARDEVKSKMESIVKERVCQSEMSEDSLIYIGEQISRCNYYFKSSFITFNEWSHKFFNLSYEQLSTILKL